MINVVFYCLICFDRKQEQQGTSEEEVQDLKEGEAAPQEEGQGGKEARPQSQEEDREGPWYPQRLALQGTGAQGSRSPPCSCYRGVGATESRPQRKGIHSCLPSYCLFYFVWDLGLFVFVIL